MKFGYEIFSLSKTSMNRYQKDIKTRPSHLSDHVRKLQSVMLTYLAAAAITLYFMTKHNEILSPMVIMGMKIFSSLKTSINRYQKYIKTRPSHLCDHVRKLQSVMLTYLAAAAITLYFMTKHNEILSPMVRMGMKIFFYMK